MPLLFSSSLNTQHGESRAKIWTPPVNIYVRTVLQVNFFKNKNWADQIFHRLIGLTTRNGLWSTCYINSHKQTEENGLFLIEKKKRRKRKKRRNITEGVGRTKQKALRRLAAERKWPGTDQAISIDIWSFNVVINLDKWPSTFWKKKRRGGPQHNKTKTQSVSMFFVCLSGVRLYFHLVFLFCFLIVDNSLAILIDSGGAQTLPD